MFEEAEADPSLAKKIFDRRELRLRTALLNAQYSLLSRADRTLLVVIAGIAGSGKGDAVNLMNAWMDPRHIHTLAFDTPSPAQSQYPPFWRYWNALTAKGRIGIVFGSWYVPLLKEAARKRPDADFIEREAERIRRLEATLSANGVQIVKLWYHMSAQAQCARTQALLSSPETAWKVMPEDLKVPKQFERLRNAGLAAIERTDMPAAPWTVVPAADTPLRHLRTAQILLAALRRQQAPRPARAQAAAGKSTRRIRDRLGEVDYEALVDKNDYEIELGLLQGRLARATRSPRFHKDHSLVLVFEGQDAAGKGGAIRRVTHALDARQFEITPVSAPNSDDLAHPYLWRFWRHVPRPGRIAIFDRSWYGRVLVERVEGYAAPSDWRRAYGEINDFEAQLADKGAIVLKFWLAVTQDVQLARFKEREHSPFKNFKITPDDWRNRKRWNDYARAANEMLARTDTPAAPWNLISANDKRYARLQVLRQIVHAIETRL
ncbi:polyphosphate:AMP phosphotransferase [Bordetella sp. FB-8]|uniref:polyphosphate:AMP phosphotransferase n=1 Tax=Bordetella sp. FB-8 TaxID=1159870 RepID=UPI000374F0DB|nr:polyphosphate:AMP phosphotransferase [Bordetella sp. FB-8]